MKKILRFLSSFYRNVILKRKFKVFWALLTDKEFQKNLNHLYELTKNCTRIERLCLNAEQICYGHKIFYRSYCVKLADNKDDIPRIKVVADPKLGEDKYRVVDGNHRFLALLLRGQTVIYCEVMT